MLNTGIGLGIALPFSIRDLKNSPSREHPDQRSDIDHFTPITIATGIRDYHPYGGKIFGSIKPRTSMQSRPREEGLILHVALNRCKSTPENGFGNSAPPNLARMLHFVARAKWLETRHETFVEGPSVAKRSRSVAQAESSAILELNHLLNLFVCSNLRNQLMTICI